MIQKICTISFSPTGTTAKAADHLGQIIAEKLKVPLIKDSFTLPVGQKQERHLTKDTLVIFGIPTYAGRIPNKILPFVQQLFKGNGGPAVALVTFGNRSYDSALAELVQELTKNNFTVFAAAAFAAPHAFAHIGEAHPTAADRHLLDKFAGQAVQLLENTETLSTVELGMHGNVAPYYIPKGMDGKPAKFLKAKPKTDSARCTHCGLCAKVCPMGAIDQENTDLVSGTCIKCQACIKNCPVGAKYFDDAAFLSHKEYLETHFQHLALSEIFL